MTRTMIDATHDGLPSAMATIRAMAPGNVVALYDTGSPDIAATSTDINGIPSHLKTIFIDQGFTGSPNLRATVRDCENGAWQLARAVNRTGWQATRPTLYLGFPDNANMAAQMGWKGDVWLVAPSNTAPTEPPSVPAGLNVVAVQWNFKNAGFDESVVFDPSWPEVRMSNVTVPNVVGQSAGEAHNALVAAGLVPTADPGQKATEIVARTVPAVGSNVAAGSHVQIVTSLSGVLVTLGATGLTVTQVTSSDEGKTWS